MLKIKFSLVLFEGENGAADEGICRERKLSYVWGCAGRKMARRKGNAKENNKIPFGVARGEKGLAKCGRKSQKGIIRSQGVKAERSRIFGLILLSGP